LLYDALRKVIDLTARLCATHDVLGWRQWDYNIKQLKKSLRIIQQNNRGKKKESVKQAAYQSYLDLAQFFLARALLSVETLVSVGANALKLEAINDYIRHAQRQIDQIERRIMKGEIIPHSEKVFSIFAPHTEWNVKGKAGVPVELGLKVCVIEDHHQFILHHQVMEKVVDSDVTVSMLESAKARFPTLSSCSFDKGFYSPDNHQKLSELLDTFALPKKGKLSKANKLEQATEAFQQARQKHSAVESAINALEVHGLDCCPDKGIAGFKRYVSLAIVARNIQRLGTALLDQERRRLKRKNNRIALKTV
jgi:hypothetical protein